MRGKLTGSRYKHTKKAIEDILQYNPTVDWARIQAHREDPSPTDTTPEPLSEVERAVMELLDAGSIVLPEGYGVVRLVRSLFFVQVLN